MDGLLRWRSRNRQRHKIQRERSERGPAFPQGTVTETADRAGGEALGEAIAADRTSRWCSSAI
jgi:hypothetical protein